MRPVSRCPGGGGVLQHHPADQTDQGEDRGAGLQSHTGNLLQVVLSHNGSSVALLCIWFRRLCFPLEKVKLFVFLRMVRLPPTYAHAPPPSPVLYCTSADAPLMFA